MPKRSFELMANDPEGVREHRLVAADKATRARRDLDIFTDTNNDQNDDSTDDGNAG